MVDLHTHIIPGIDDGAQTLDESLEMARLAVADGITTLAATPHAYWRGEVNSGPTIRGGVAELTAQFVVQDIPLKLVTGAEVPMERHLVNKVRSDHSWTYGGNGIYLLLEPPWGPIPDYALRLVAELIQNDITPLIAHPERNPDLRSNFSLLDRMLQLGAVAQITANSILGNHGVASRLAALKMLETSRAHVVSSDAHNTDTRPPMLSEARAVVTDMLGEDPARLLFEENPYRVLKGQPLLAVPGAPPSARSSAPSGNILTRVINRLRR